MKSLRNTPNESELRKLIAILFNQDALVLYADPIAEAEGYIQNLPADRRRALRDDLAAFLETHSDRSTRGLRNRWLALGVAYWPEVDTRATLKTFLEFT